MCMCLMHDDCECMIIINVHVDLYGACLIVNIDGYMSECIF